MIVLGWVQRTVSVHHSRPSVHPSIHPPNTHTLFVSKRWHRGKKKDTHRDRCTFAQTRKTSENYTLGLVWQFKANTLNSDIYMGRHARQRMIDKSPAPCTFCNKKHWLRLTQGAGTQPRSQGSGVSSTARPGCVSPSLGKSRLESLVLSCDQQSDRWHVLNCHYLSDIHTLIHELRDIFGVSLNFLNC